MCIQYVHTSILFTQITHTNKLIRSVLQLDVEKNARWIFVKLQISDILLYVFFTYYGMSPIRWDWGSKKTCIHSRKRRQSGSYFFVHFFP